MVRLILVLALWPLLSSVGARSIHRGVARITKNFTNDQEAACLPGGGGSQCAPLQSGSSSLIELNTFHPRNSFVVVTETDTRTQTVTAGESTTSPFPFNPTILPITVAPAAGTSNPAEETTTADSNNATTSILSSNQTTIIISSPTAITGNPATETTTVDGNNATSTPSNQEPLTTTTLIIPFSIATALPSNQTQTFTGNPATETTTADGNIAPTSILPGNQTGIITPSSTVTAGSDASSTGTEIPATATVPTVVAGGSEASTLAPPTQNTSLNGAATGTTPASAIPTTTTTSDIQAANALNSMFATLTPTSPCTEGENACVEGNFAQCVGGTFVLTQCDPGTTCAALPMGNVPGTTITCTTPEDRDARLGA